jgi:hypothetical protein
VIIVFARVGTETRLHLGGSCHRIIGRRESGHHFVADGLDDGAIELMGGVFHDIQAVRNGFTGLGVTEFIVQLGAADNVGEQNYDFQVFGHVVLT